jgi:enamine deaminase RidA (YjgF/YER057c/UK114 family)
MSSLEKKLAALALALPPCPAPVGSYQPVVIAERTAYLSGQVSKTAEGKIIAGKVGAELTLEEGAAAARAAALNVVSVIKHLVGFPRFGRILRIVGYVQAAPGFYDLPRVLNGASDLFLELFGENGVHARSAVGMAALPLNAAVELEATVLLKD